MYDKGKDSEPVQALLAVGKTLMHGCPLILWEDVTSCVEINQTFVNTVTGTTSLRWRGAPEI